MRVKYFAVRDIKAAHYMQCFPSESAGTAERTFKEAIKDPNSLMSKYPEDFSLYQVFDFDDETGAVTPLDSPHHICEGSNVIQFKPS